MSSLKTSLLICAIAIPFVACELAGEQTPASATRSPIIGGTAVNDGSWPAVGAVTLEPDSMCTGTLIAPKVVVTAAHCVKGENPTKFTLGYDMDNGTDYTVQTAVYNPSYDSGSYSDPGSGDVAILVLSTEVTGVTPAELFQGDFTQFSGKQAIFVGYGKRDVYEALYGLKYQVSVTIEDIDADGFWNYTTESDVHNTCGGDSGGPGFVLSGGKYYIGGFVSSGDEYCVSDGYNMRADSNAEWILSQVEKYNPGYLTEAVCGNGTCEYGEDNATCADDCPVVTTVCGNGKCETDETTATCPADCPAATDDIWADCSTDGTCPDGQFCVQISETEANCTIACSDLELGADCGYQDMACNELQDGSGACIRGDITCGDGECVYGESAATCPADCDFDCGTLTFAGCCDGTKAVYCDNGQFRTVECGPDYGCGWVADGGYYFCVEGTPTEDPSGELPMSCDGFTWEKCGNGTCDSGETTAKCPADCPATENCGNGTCDNGETNATCPQDCTTVDEDCGNGTCDSWETTDSCPVDCHVANNCGNGTCDNDEDKTSCPSDCNAAAADCGNGACEVGEGCRDCPSDCGQCPSGDVIENGDTHSPTQDATASDDDTVTDNGGSDGCSAGNGPSSPVGLLMVMAMVGCFVGINRLRRRA